MMGADAVGAARQRRWRFRGLHLAVVALLLAADWGCGARAGGPDGFRHLAASLSTESIEGRPAPATRTGAEIIAAGDREFAGAQLRIGAILPLSGRLSTIGTLLHEGILIAIDRYRDAHPNGFDIELDARDDRSDPANAARLVRALEREDVLAIIGPFGSESFAMAVQARSDSDLPIISPTATEILVPGRAAYTMYDAAARDSGMATDLARWTVDELGLRRVAIMEPAGAGGGTAGGAFARTVEEMGGQIVGHERYDPALTSLQTSIEALSAAGPDVVFAPSTSVSGVLSVAPQLFYYGLYDVIVIGSETWADPAVLGRLDDFATDHRVVGLAMDRVTPDTTWQQFVVDYERKYRKSLRNNIMPALAHDAAALVLAALEGAQIPLPAALARYLETGPVVRGVTGVYRPDAGRSVVHRETRIRMLVDGMPVEADRAELRRWLAEVREAPSPLAPRDTLPR